MNIAKKLSLYCLTIGLCLLTSDIQAKKKTSGFIKFLFPIPTALYNAGCEETLDNQTRKIQDGSFFEIFYPGDINTTFKDVAGLDGAKEDLQDIIDFLKNPEKFKRMGANIPKGILMNGTPGNGKTLLARAAAGEINCPFISVNGSGINGQYVGEGTARVKELFQAARSIAPCIIFIDEIDAVASKRSDSPSGASRDRNETITALLTEMDGLHQHGRPIIILGATNRVDQLDPAIIRPGRFDRIIEIPKPFIKDRAQLLRIAFAQSNLSDDVNIDRIARGTAGFSGAELANLANEAAILAVKDNSDTICMRHIEAAHDNITLGREIKGMVQSQDDLWHTAIHEAGHLIGFLFQDKTMAVHKVSIVPRGDTLGVAHMLPLFESYDITQNDMINQIVVCLCGRFAEESFGFGLSTGARNDLEHAKQIAYNMVVTYGMAEGLRDISYAQFGDELPNDVATKIDLEVNKIIEKCRVITFNLITKHKKDIEKIAKLLMEKGTVQGDEIYRLLNLPQPQGVGF